MIPENRFVSETSFFVRYAETDAMGIVHHSVYIVYFEEARSHYSRVVGADYAALERSGYWLTVAEVAARYAVPARYGQRLTARCWVDSLRSRGITFGYEIADSDSGTVHVTGQTCHVCITHEGKVTHLPKTWSDTIKKRMILPEK